MTRQLLVLAIVATALLPAPAVAHARYERSDPADGATVSSPPSSVWAEFSEPPAPSSYLVVYDPCGRRVDNGNSQATAYRITASMSALAAGTYRAEWAVLSTLDGHTTQGTFTFTSSGGGPCPEEEEPAPSGPEPRGGGDGAGAALDPVPARETSGAARGGRAGRGEGGTGDDRGGRRPARREERPSQDGPPRAPGDRSTSVFAQDPAGADADFPVDGLVIGLALAALVGAAGGYVYAGIMGPRP